MFKKMTSLFAKPKQQNAIIANSITIDKQLSRLGWLGDADEVLLKAGISRAHLRSLETDDEIYAALETRRDACINTPWRIEHNSVRNRKLFEEILAPYIHTLLNAFWYAVPYGYSVVEIVYTKDAQGRIGIGQVLPVPFEWVIPKYDGELLWHESQQPLDNRKFFACIRQASLRNVRGEALLSRLYWVWFFRTNGWKFWMKYLERAGIPFLVGKTNADKNEALNALLAASQDSVIVAGRDDDISALEFGRDPKIFTEFEQAVVRRYQRLILGQTLTSGTDGSGSRALGDVHNEVRKEKKRADIRLVSESIQQIINQLAELNNLEPVTFIMQDDTGLESDRAKRDKTLTDAGMVKFTDTYIKEKYGLEADYFTIPENKPIPTPTTNTEAVKLAATFAAEPTFTPAQQAVEDIADSALTNAGNPIAPDVLRKLVLSATSPEDLEQKLAQAINSRDSAFQEVLAQAIFTADVLGYVASDKHIL